MTFNAHPTTSGGKPSLTTSEVRQDLTSAIWRFWGNVRAKGASALRKVQVSRMKSVLMSLDDQQLKQIDVKRSDISRYAESLVSEE